MEKKYLDTLIDSNIVVGITGAETNPAGLGSVCAVPQGSGQSQRVGRQYVLTSLKFKGVVHMPIASGATATNPRFIRMAVVLDEQCNGVELNAEDVFKSTGVAANDVYTFKNIDYKDRFRILHDESFILESQSAAGDGAANDFSAIIKSFDVNVKLNEMVTTHNAGSTVASITDNSISIITWSNITNCDIVGICRIRFVG